MVKHNKYAIETLSYWGAWVVQHAGLSLMAARMMLRSLRQQKTPSRVVLCN